MEIHFSHVDDPTTTLFTKDFDHEPWEENGSALDHAERWAEGHRLNVADTEDDYRIIIDTVVGSCDACGNDGVFLPAVENVWVCGEIDDTFRFCLDCVNVEV